MEVQFLQPRIAVGGAKREHAGEQRGLVDSVQEHQGGHRRSSGGQHRSRRFLAVGPSADLRRRVTGPLPATGVCGAGRPGGWPVLPAEGFDGGVPARISVCPVPVEALQARRHPGYNQRTHIPAAFLRRQHEPGHRRAGAGFLFPLHRADGPHRDGQVHGPRRSLPAVTGDRQDLQGGIHPEDVPLRCGGPVHANIRHGVRRSYVVGRDQPGIRQQQASNPGRGKRPGEQGACASQPLHRHGCRGPVPDSLLSVHPIGGGNPLGVGLQPLRTQRGDRRGRSAKRDQQGVEDLQEGRRALGRKGQLRGRGWFRPVWHTAAQRGQETDIRSLQVAQQQRTRSDSQLQGTGGDFEYMDAGIDAHDPLLWSAVSRFAAGNC